MADTKVSALAELATAPAADDELLVVDKSDTSMAASGTDKRITPQNLGIPIIVRKTADETVNNSSVLQNDDHLAVAVAASSVYLVDLTLLTQAANATADWEFGWTYPASTTIRWSAVGALAAYPWGAVAVGTTQLAVLTEAQTQTAGGAGVSGVIPIRAIVATAGTAGTLQFQWAQDVANATDSKLLTNSVLMATKIG